MKKISNEDSILRRRQHDKFVFRRRMAIEAVFFLILALVSTWPLARHVHDHLPLGTEEASTVPLFNLWTVWWNADRAAAGYQGYWRAPIFHPADDAFSYSEPMVLSLAAAPLIRLTENRILAYNFLLLLALWLNGWTACRLLRRFHLHPVLPWLGGVMVALMPLVQSWLGVLQLVPLFGMVLTFQAVYRFARRPGVAGGLLLGGSLALTYLLCSYYGLFLFLPLVVSTGWLLGGRLWQGRTWASLLPGGLLCLLLCLPVVLAQQSALTAPAVKPGLAYLAGLSATLADYLVPPGQAMSPFTPLIPPGHEPVFKLGAGLQLMALAVLGGFSGILRVKRRRWTLFCLSMAGLSLCLSLGPLLKIGEIRPYLFLVEYVPGFAQARNIFRFAVITHLMITFLAVFGLQALMVAASRFTAPGKYRRITRGLVIAVALSAIFAMRPAPQSVYAPPDRGANRAWLTWLADHTPENTVIACVPFPLKPDVASYQQEAIWMYWQTYHKRKMINGYSGRFPEHFHKLKWPMAQFPAAQTIAVLLDLGIEYCVVQRNSAQGQALFGLPPQTFRLEMVFRDDKANIDIYRLPISRHEGL